MKHISILFLAGCAWVMAAGCSSSSSSPADASTSGAALIGDPCTTNADCASSYCVTSEQFGVLTKQKVDIPGGYCALLSCNTKADCGAGADCYNLAQYDLQLFICLKNCTSNSDCRQGYTCTNGSGPNLPGFPDKACLPPPLLCILDVPDPSCPADAGTDAPSDATGDTGSTDSGPSDAQADGD
jgi:hypothetical protein